MSVLKNSLSNLSRFCGEVREPNESETVLRIQNDNRLNFENHIKSLFNKASQILGAL